MSGNRQSALRNTATILARDPDHFKKMGQKVGKAVWSKPRGFAAMDRKRRLEISARGGKSKRKGASV